ncbi:hypothetical protein N7488_002194 [Penicillium malachiteum]|nr:hypothetical protein N7488_002194 [Penicillium malachiteum]
MLTSVDYQTVEKRHRQSERYVRFPPGFRSRSILWDTDQIETFEEDFARDRCPALPISSTWLYLTRSWFRASDHLDSKLRVIPLEVTLEQQGPGGSLMNGGLAGQMNICQVSMLRRAPHDEEWLVYNKWTDYELDVISTNATGYLGL